LTGAIYSTGEYLRNNPTWHAEDSAWKAQQVMRMLRAHRIQPRTVCEAGCGAGEILHCLQEMLPGDCEFEGYDVSPQAHAIAKSRENGRLRFLQGEISEKPGRADLMLVMDVIEHLEDYYSFLRAVRDRGDRLIAHVPLDMCVNHLLRERPLADLRTVVGHIHSFTKESALAVLREAGFRVVDHFYTKWSIEFPPRTWRRRAALWPRKIAFQVAPDITVRILGGFSLLVLAEPAATG